ncbi:RNA ligase [Mumia sp. DW29H23]|uniref:RNA ligase n=1 Tax=Mumia sp. DW29H23 TaxID=3421241 RepID=UPI003D697354
MSTESLTLDQILDVADLSVAIKDGYVREREHPDDPDLVILNYAEKAQYERVWTPVTRACRGLIVRKSTGVVLARPWEKFFNYGEHPVDALDLDASAEVTDKMDGSLGILYPAPDGWAIATRGSFTSEQAVHATALLRREYLEHWSPLPGLTYLFEIVYPSNRIVLDYAGLDDLVLLGTRHISTGYTFGPTSFPWDGPRTTTYPESTLREALARAPRSNAEGLVVRRRIAGLMVKIKQDDYVRLHKLVTGLSERAVWEHLAAHGGSYDALLASVPDEFHGWVRDHAEALIDRHEDIVGRAHAEHHHLLEWLGDDFERKQYALACADNPLKGLMFHLLDGRDITPVVWKQIRPVGANPMRHISEDVA